MMPMLGIRVRPRSAEALRKYLKKKGLLESNHRVISRNSFIYFPISAPLAEKERKKIKELGAVLVQRGFRSAKKRSKTVHGYDLYGSIAVIECEAGEASGIAKRIMKNNKNIKTVLRKGGAVGGRYRTRKFLYVAGKRSYIADYKENGCTFRFDIRKTFFSTRLAYERKRVADLVRNGENVIVMFAGVGPYAIEIAKAHRRCKVVAVELNRSAFGYMKENIKLNKTQNVFPEQGDVGVFTKRYAYFADRIVMPLPKESAHFLPAALKMARKGCEVHYYTFCPSDRIGETIKNTLNFFASNKKRAKLLGSRIVRQYSANDVELVADFSIS